MIKFVEENNNSATAKKNGKNDVYTILFALKSTNLN